jgi:hypothetical protein
VTSSARCGWCCSRRRTWRWCGAIRPNGAVRRRPCSCSGSRATPGYGPTTSGSSSSATPCSARRTCP